MLEALVAHQIQLGLIEGPDGRNGLRIEPFLEDFMALVVPPGHLWADRDIDVEAYATTPVDARAGLRIATNR